MTITDPYENRYPDADVWEMIRAMEPGVPYGASELAAEIDTPRRTAHRYLDIFHEGGVVEKKDLTPRVAWYIPLERAADVRDADPEGEAPDATDPDMVDTPA